MPFVLFLVFAAVEITVLIAVGQAIGLLPTLGLLLAGTIGGSWLARREGIRSLRAFVEAVNTRRPPHQELLDGVLVAGAGLLILLPGLVSDAMGLLMLVPPLRALLAKRWARRAEAGGHLGGPSYRPATVVDRDNVVDGEVVDVDPGERRHPAEPRENRWIE